MLSANKKIDSFAIRTIVALLFTLVLVSIDWESYQFGGSDFVDKKRYFEYFTYRDNVLTYTETNNLIDLIKREYLWHFGVDYLINTQKMDIDHIFFFITISCLFIFSIFILNRTSPIYLFLLINPLIITFAFSQLRSALAITLLMTAYLLRKYPIFFILALIAVFIHSVAILIILIFFCIKILFYIRNKNILSHLIFVGFLFITGATVSLVTGLLRSLVLSHIDDRRANYSGSSSSLAYALFWIGLLAVFFLQKKDFFRSEANRVSFTILSIAAVSPLTGSYTTRFIVMFFPVIIYSMSQISSNMKLYAIGAYIAYAILQWIYWLRIGW